MNNKGKSILLLIPMSAVIFLLVVLNVAVLVQGRVSLHQTGAENQETEAAVENEPENEENTEMTAQIESFSIDRTSNVIGEAQETQAEPSGEYLCAESMVKVLNEDDVANLKAGSYDNLPDGKDIIQMVVNEIYARNGYQFSNEEIQAYFAAKSWYQPSSLANPGDMDAIYAGMSDIDKANIDFLKEIR